MKFRLFNKLYANFFGYFWCPCPLCNKFFGGHEWKRVDNQNDTIPKSSDSGIGICPDCTKKGLGNIAWNEFWIINPDAAAEILHD